MGSSVLWGMRNSKNGKFCTKACCIWLENCKKWGAIR